jgi:hypothetical protein
MSETKRKVFGAECKAKVGLGANHEVKTLNQIIQSQGESRTPLIALILMGDWRDLFAATI